MFEFVHCLLYSRDDLGSKSTFVSLKQNIRIRKSNGCCKGYPSNVFEFVHCLLYAWDDLGSKLTFALLKQNIRNRNRNGCYNGCFLSDRFEFVHFFL